REKFRKILNAKRKLKCQGAKMSHRPARGDRMMNSWEEPHYFTTVVLSQLCFQPDLADTLCKVRIKSSKQKVFVSVKFYKLHQTFADSLTTRYLCTSFMMSCNYSSHL